MGENTKVEWATHSFNPWVGCSNVSPGCDNCYAETMAKRYKWHDWGAGTPRKLTSEANWRKPWQWNKKAMETGERHRVFCASLADVFDNQVPEDWRWRLWYIVQATPHLDWLMLTKRPQNIAKMLPSDWGDGYPNVWLGISAESQEEYNRRWPILSGIPAALRFVSYEPALGPLTLMDGLMCENWPDWVIAGGESGPGARSCNADWFRRIQAECWAGGIPFFLKQWGDYRNNPLYYYEAMKMYRVKEIDPPSNGKGGALLDGRIWREIPQTVS